MDQVQRYRSRISGPLLDRIDLHVEVPKLPHQVLRTTESTATTSADTCQRVTAARAKQLNRASKLNHALSSKEIELYCNIDEKTGLMLERAVEKLGLSARAYHRILKTARTIADLEDSSNIESIHLGEAISYRKLDRQPTSTFNR